jgi:hypothetical protein
MFATASRLGRPGGNRELPAPWPPRLAASRLAVRNLSLQSCDLRAPVVNLRPSGATAGLTACSHSRRPCHTRPGTPFPAFLILPPHALDSARSDCFSEPIVASTAVGS